MEVMLQTYSGIGRPLTAAGWHSIKTHIFCGGLRRRDANNKQRLQNKILLLLLLFTAIGLSPGGSGYFTCIQNMKLVI